MTAVVRSTVKPVTKDGKTKLVRKKGYTSKRQILKAAREEKASPPPPPPPPALPGSEAKRFSISFSIVRR